MDRHVYRHVDRHADGHVTSAISKRRSSVVVELHFSHYDLNLKKGVAANRGNDLSDSLTG